MLHQLNPHWMAIVKESLWRHYERMLFSLPEDAAPADVLVLVKYGTAILAYATRNVTHPVPRKQIYAHNRVLIEMALAGHATYRKMLRELFIAGLVTIANLHKEECTETSIEAIMFLHEAAPDDGKVVVS